MVISKRIRPGRMRVADSPVDVCLVVEGAYPYVTGGVSSWIDGLIRSQPHLTFAVAPVVAMPGRHVSRYERPSNLLDVRDVALGQAAPAALRRRWVLEPQSVASRPDEAADELASALGALASGGGFHDFRRVEDVVNSWPRSAGGFGFSHAELLQSPFGFEVARRMYRAVAPHTSFLQFYWAWRSLAGGLFALLKSDVPPARCYHAVSTGYAGLLAAHAALRTGAPAMVTEHGIYTNERRIDILLADWVSDTVDKGLSIADARVDMRDLWVRMFDGFARVCYEACDVITTLYRDNQELQLALGADARKLRVIANGIDVRRFDSLDCAGTDARPTIALIGRVVPIKDVKTFIAAAGIVRRRVPELRALVMGPTDEDPAYFQECNQLVRDLGLGDCVEFTGSVKITDWMAQIHVVVLTSLSEAQPLVLIEAGAAGIACVATNVGACREIIEGSAADEAAPERGGFVTDLVAPEETAQRICELLSNPALRVRCGAVLRSRVRQFYASEISRGRYAALYETVLSGRAIAVAGGGA